MYNARITTDNGMSFGFGPAYGSVFDISPLSGSDVNIATSQGFQQIGVTIENQSVGGISRTIRGVFIDGKNTAIMQSMLESLPVFTRGRLYFNDQYYTDIVFKKTPSIVKKQNGKTSFSMMVFCADPFWHLVEDVAYNIGDYTPMFEFPILYDEHIFAQKNPSSFVDCYNMGSVKVPFLLRFTCDASVENPGIVNANTLEYIKINRTILLGDVIEIYRENGRLYVHLTRNGETSDIFSSLDEDSDLFWIYPGENIIRLTADDALESLVGVVSFNPAYMGVLDEA